VEGAYFFGKRLKPIASTRHNNQMCPSGSKLSGERGTDATAGTGDKGCLVVVAHR